MFAHPKYCENCERKACLVRTDLPTYKIVLKPGYTACHLDINNILKYSSITIFDLKITEEAEYKARPLPHQGLDLIRNHSNDSMLSDRADFHFHEHDFEISDSIPFYDGDKRKTGIKFRIPKETQCFFGDAAALIKRRKKSDPKPVFRVEPGEYFHSIYKNEEHIGFGINQMLYAYNFMDDSMLSHEDLYNMRIIKYTDKATRTADGIIFAGMQRDNWMNLRQGIKHVTWLCKGCLSVNGGSNN